MVLVVWVQVQSRFWFPVCRFTTNSSGQMCNFSVTDFNNVLSFDQGHQKIRPFHTDPHIAEVREHLTSRSHLSFRQNLQSEVQVLNPLLPCLNLQVRSTRRCWRPGPAWAPSSLSPGRESKANWPWPPNHRRACRTKRFTVRFATCTSTQRLS